MQQGENTKPKLLIIHALVRLGYDNSLSTKIMVCLYLCTEEDAGSVSFTEVA